MIVVTGAAGHLGRRTVELLLERVDASDVVAATRDPGKLDDLAARGVTVRAADFDEPDGLARAFDGAERLLLVSTSELRPGLRVEQHRRAVDAAARAGVGHVVYTSFTRPSEDNPAGVSTDHRETERALAAAGVPWTALRNNLYTEALLQQGAPAVASGVLATNGAGGAAGYVTREDCAAAAAGLLASGGHVGEALEITGPASVPYEEVAEALGAATGRPVRVQALDDQQAVDGAVAAGVPEPFAHLLASFGRAVREGWLDVTTPYVAELSGREPTPVADFLAAHRTELLAAS